MNIAMTIPVNIEKGQDVLEAIRDAYTLFESLNLSVSGVIAIGVVLLLAFLVAIREAATWFFKIDDLKRDLSELREISTQLEGEIRSLQNIISALKSNTDISARSPDCAPESLPDSLPDSLRGPAEKTSASFPIVH